MKVKSLSRARLLATPWTAAYQAPPSMGFSRQEDWSGVLLPSPGQGSRTQLKPQSFNRAACGPGGTGVFLIRVLLVLIPRNSPLPLEGWAVPGG